MTANCQCYYLPDYLRFPSLNFVMVHIFVYVHEALTWLIHNLLSNFRKLDAWNMDTVIMNCLEKMCHTATVACMNLKILSKV